MAKNNLEDKLNDYSIGIFDSGVGGLTVMRAIVDLLPNENIIYFGDNARMPYGNKSPQMVEKFALENALFLIEKKIKYLVVACNTASAFAMEKLADTFSLSMSGVIDPAVEKIISLPNCQNIVILGTKGTINSEAYQNKLKDRLPDVTLYSVPCPLFVPLIEEGHLGDSITQLIAKSYLAHLQDKNIDTVLLGCTHYPLIKKLIQDYFGSGVAIVDSAYACAEVVSRELNCRGLKASSSNGPTYQFFTSDDPEHFQKFGESFLNMPIDCVCKA